MSFEGVPEPILYNIFNDLDFRTLGRAERVCKAWNQFIRNSTLWKEKGRDIERMIAKTKKEEADRIRKLKKAREKDKKNREIYFIFLHSPLTEFVGIALMTLTILLIPLKLDKYIGMTWTSVLMPLMLYFFMFAIRAFSYMFYFENLPYNWDQKPRDDPFFIFLEQWFIVGRGMHICIFWSSLGITASIGAMMLILDMGSAIYNVVVPAIAVCMIIFVAGLFQFGEKPTTIFYRYGSWSFPAYGQPLTSLIICVVSLVFALYFVFLGLKMADKIDWSWTTVHIPAWVIYAGALISPSALYIKQKGVVLLIIGIWILSLGPFCVTHILVCVTLDGIRDYCALKICTPVVVWAGLLVLLTLRHVIVFLTRTKKEEEDSISMEFKKVKYVKPSPFDLADL